MSDFDPHERQQLLERYENGEDLGEEVVTTLRRQTSVDRWMQAGRARLARASAQLSLVSSGPSELERAQAYRTKIGKQLDEVVKTINEARADGMTISFQIGPPDGFNRQSLVLLEIMKKLC